MDCRERPYEDIYGACGGYVFKKDGLYGWANSKGKECFPAKSKEKLLAVFVRSVHILEPKGNNAYNLYELSDSGRFYKKGTITQKELDTLYEERKKAFSLSQYAFRTDVVDIPYNIGQKFW